MPQSALTSVTGDILNKYTVSMVTKVATPTDPAAIQMGASSPTLVSEPDTPLQSGTGTSFTVPAITESVVKFTTGVIEEGEGEGEGDTVDRGGERGEKEGGELEEVETGRNGLVVGGGGEQAGSIMQSQEILPQGLNFDLPTAPLETLPYTPSSPLLPTTMETVALEIQEEIEEEVKEQIEQPLPLVDIGEGRPLSISESPRTSVSGTMPPLSSGGHPLEQGEHQLEVTEHQPQDSDNRAHKLDVHEAGITPPSSFHPLSEVAPSDAVFTGAVATHLSDPLSSAPLQPPPSSLLGPSLHPQPYGGQEDVMEELQAMAARGDVGPDPVVLVPRRPSPFPEVVEGVREALYTAWIPSPWTQSLLSQPTSVTQQHLTCPGLVADIKMVRGV